MTTWPVLAQSSSPRGGLGSVGAPCCGCCCDDDPPGPELGGLFWYNARLSDTHLNGADQSAQWNDLWPSAYHQIPQDSSAALAPVGQWPVYTPTICPSGEPGMDYHWTGPGDFGCTLTQCLQTVTQLPDDTPYFVTAIITPKSTLGGFVCTMRLNVFDCEMSLRKNGPFHIVLASQTNTHDYWTPIVDYTGQTIVCTWIFYGSAAPLQCAFRVNGVDISPLANFLGLVPYTGLRGFSIGYNNAVFEGFHGYITDVRGYLGTNMTTVLASEAWAMNFAGIP